MKASSPSAQPMVAGSLGMATEHQFSGESAALKRRLFTLALLLSTWIPIGCFIAVGFSDTPGPGLQVAKATLVFINGLHVAATLGLYVDKQFLRLIREERARYVYMPLALILGSGLVFALAGPVIQAYWLLIYWAWQAHHYGRQNIGIYSLAAIAQGRRVGRAERRALELATGCAVCGTLKILGMGVAPSYLHGLFEGFYRAGACAFVGVLGYGIYRYVTNRTEASLTQAAFFFTLLLFFAPLFLSSNVTVAFSSYAVAHGIQYIVIMTVLASSLGLNEGRRGVSGRMMILFAAVILLGGLVSLRDAGWGGYSGFVRSSLDFAAGMALGTAAAHFVVDAGAWRLSRPAVSAYMARRFGFLLGSPRLRTPV